MGVELLFSPSWLLPQQKDTDGICAFFSNDTYLGSLSRKLQLNGGQCQHDPVTGSGDFVDSFLHINAVVFF